MSKLSIEVVYAEDDFVVVSKPSGLLSVSGKGPENQHCVTSIVRELFPDSIEQPSVHRLDMDTSGLLVLGLTKEVHRNLSIQFQERRVKKRYEALLDGVVVGETGTIELPFRLDVENRPHQIYDPVYGKLGVTHWQVMDCFDNITRISFKPVTGRTHQLRVHAAHELGLGIPIVGDPLYGNGTGSGQLKLHAAELIFFHPHHGKLLHFTSKVPF